MTPRTHHMSFICFLLWEIEVFKSFLEIAFSLFLDLINSICLGGGEQGRKIPVFTADMFPGKNHWSGGEREEYSMALSHLTRAFCCKTILTKVVCINPGHKLSARRLTLPDVTEICHEECKQTRQYVNGALVLSHGEGWLLFQVNRQLSFEKPRI